MAFEDLTENQRRLVVELIEELASGNYSSEFWAGATHGKRCFLTLRASFIEKLYQQCKMSKPSSSASATLLTSPMRL